MILYHYAARNTFDEFLRTRHLRFSAPSSIDEARPVQGWYFTDLEPWCCDIWTPPHCWRNLGAFPKGEYYLKLDIPDAIVARQGDHLYSVDVWDQRIEYLEGKEAPSNCKDACPLSIRWSL
jgi:hypothetical protein